MTMSTVKAALRRCGLARPARRPPGQRPGDRGGGERADECPIQGQAAVTGPGRQRGRAVDRDHHQRGAGRGGHVEAEQQDPPLPYAQISARLGIPAGSIGPSRGRCLAKLRRHPAIAARPWSPPD
jgi:hypothetical protein